MLRLLWDNALRRSEVCNLNVGDFDAQMGTLSILGKGKGTQKVTVDLSSKTVEAIVDWLITCHRTNFTKKPLFMVRKYETGTYPKFTANEIAVLERYRYPIRLGSYGDPTAVPIKVWEPIIRASSRYTEYTHQSRNNYNYNWQQYLMASVESEEEARVAQILGWRTFRIMTPDAPLSKNEILCRHTEDDRIQCKNCLLCDGASSKPNIADKVHGLNWKISNFVKYSESISN